MTMTPGIVSRGEEYDQPGDAAPDWLVELIHRSAPPSRGFLDACVQSSAAGLALAKLRRASQRMGGALLAAPEYLRGLTAVAQVSSEVVCRWAGLSNDFRPNRQSAAGWGNLARVLGLSLREAILRFRLALADDLGLELMPVQARGEAVLSVPAPSLEDWEAGFAAEAGRLSPESLDLLDECEAAVRLAYAAEPAEREPDDVLR
jgi:hypothetical protein